MFDFAEVPARMFIESSDHFVQCKARMKRQLGVHKEYGILWCISVPVMKEHAPEFSHVCFVSFRDLILL